MTTRNLLALYIAVLLLPITLLTFRYVSNISFDYNEINDEIAMSQLRENLLFIYDLDFDSNHLSFRYKGKNYTLQEVNNKLLLQPGTQIYLNDIDYLYFKKENNCIYVVYSRNNKQYERVLCSQKGIYLDEFSDCDDDDTEPGDGEG